MVEWPGMESDAGMELDAKAFNAGCDARIAGLPLTANPEESDTSGSRAWRRGWLDVSRDWGAGVYDRWHVWPLPAIREQEEAQAG